MKNISQKCKHEKFLIFSIYGGYFYQCSKCGQRFVVGKPFVAKEQVERAWSDYDKRMRCHTKTNP